MLGEHIQEINTEINIKHKTVIQIKYYIIYNYITKHTQECHNTQAASQTSTVSCFFAQIHDNTIDGGFI